MNVWKPRPDGFERLRMRESGGTCPIHKCPMFQVYDRSSLNSDAHAFFNDRGCDPIGHICWICGAIPSVPACAYGPPGHVCTDCSPERIEAILGRTRIQEALARNRPKNPFGNGWWKDDPMQSPLNGVYPPK